ncbi:amino acid/amide ABC transporter membrane protein 2 (HAAT family) [Sediminihabitans luteus]|uniref:Amino acid/amide ABC transporter membrane protein 2 (HAAT family) n=1 Tax=Sediminihabitans luteus TaxID=1138585 RepID=A0A2M9CC18_9CELL|nr:branched-chain amino acid ABC transporter permease [Sediminihabitans luteus]PJJ68548.1 amino acid/amide ABC transporter membrane protein 2 (HAAT family) [Sediminihabitans luteus]GII99883.1 branched-chain amino acid ABC transporter permease [Sediminihabitans luteus]
MSTSDTPDATSAKATSAKSTSAKATTSRPTSLPPAGRTPVAQRPHAGLGDRLRLWWDALARPTQWAIGVPFILLIAALPVIRPPLLTTVGTDFGSVMAQFGMVALIAIGLNVVVGQAGLLDLGYVGFYAIGAYTVALLTSPDSPWNLTDDWLSNDWAWLACLPVAIAVTAISGLILGSPTLRLRGDYLAIVTLGFGEIVRLLADNLDSVTGGGRGLSQVAYPRVGVSEEHPNGVFSAGNASGTLNAGVWWFWVSIVLIVIALLVVGNLERSRVGRAWVAIREDEDAAEIMGVPTFRFKLWAFVIGAAIGGISGALYAGQVQFVVPTNFNVINSMLFLCAVVLGGQGNKLGVIVGAFVVVYLPNFFLGRTEIFGIPIDGNEIANYKYLFFGLALVLLMIFRPQGLFPARQKLLTYGRELYVAARAAARKVSGAGDGSGRADAVPAVDVATEGDAR